MESSNLTRYEFHGEWNYQISLSTKARLDEVPGAVITLLVGSAAASQI
jgi:hypothetical protein